jgi:hypothetical protein
MWQDDPRETASGMKVSGPIVRISMVLVMEVACGFFPRHCGGVQATPPNPKLTVTVSTSCEAMVPAYCQGRFGFRATADGAFLVGPEPNGRSVSGHLRDAERRALRSVAAQVLAGINASSVECHVRPEIPGVGESVKISAHGRTVVLRGSGGRLGRGCAPGDAVADARAFIVADQLMRRYYPNPF